MKLRNTLVTLLAGAVLTVGVAFAADTKTEAKAAKCCAKAAAEGKVCEHACCVAAAKDGKNCEKCGGSGKIETPHADAKK